MENFIIYTVKISVKDHDCSLLQQIKLENLKDIKTVNKKLKNIPNGRITFPSSIINTGV